MLVDPSRTSPVNTSPQSHRLHRSNSTNPGVLALNKNVEILRSQFTPLLGLGADMLRPPSCANCRAKDCDETFWDITNVLSYFLPVGIALVFILVTTRIEDELPSK